MLKRLINSSGPIGIDLGDDAARIMQLSTDAGAIRMIGSARVDLASLGIEHTPEAPAPDDLVRAIARLVDTGGFRSNRCIISLPDAAFNTRSARLPTMPEQELASAVSLDAPGHLGYAESRTDAQIGWLKTGDVYQGNDHKLELLYFGMPTQRLEQIAFAFSGAGLEPIAIEPRFVGVLRAMTRTLRRTADTEIVRLVLDVCTNHTSLLITRGNALVFHKIVPVGGAAMDQAAVQKLGLDPETVREIRRQRIAGSADSDERISRAMFDAVRPVMARISHEASLCLRHYSVTFRGTRPEQCTLVGTEAGEPGFDSAVHEAIGIDTVVGAPLQGIKTDHIVGANQYGPSWAAVAGIAMRDVLRRPSSRKRTQRRTSARPAPTTDAEPADKERAA